MAIIQSYPTGVPKTGDFLIGTQMPTLVGEEATTRNFSMASVLALGTAPGIATAKVLVTNAQLLTLGTVPVEILPSVAGYIYEILGITTFAKNSGGSGDSYNWSASGDGVFYGQGFTAVDHRLEVPTAQLPVGGLNPDASVFAGTPIAGRYRLGAELRLSTTLGVDPTAVLSPNATWTINVTYRLIPAS
tara:strand:+ start:600 stop:1166 length:567 start_codon:yes stop_codon:yes gene_type:complete